MSELEGYFGVLREMQAVAHDPNVVRTLLYKKARIAKVARQDPKLQPSFLFQQLRDRGFQEDFLTHVFVRSVQREKMSGHVVKILEKQLAALGEKYEKKVSELRAASLKAFEAMNMELLFKVGGGWAREDGGHGRTAGGSFFVWGGRFWNAGGMFMVDVDLLRCSFSYAVSGQLQLSSQHGCGYCRRIVVHIVSRRNSCR